MPQRQRGQFVIIYCDYNLNNVLNEVSYNKPRKVHSGPKKKKKKERENLSCMDTNYHGLNVMNSAERGSHSGLH